MDALQNKATRNGPLQFYDIDYTGGQMEEILKLTGPPPSDEGRKGKKQQKETWPNNTSLCHACKETGDLLCCDFCPAAFHLLCCNPPLDEEKAPPSNAKWACHKCVMSGLGDKDTRKHRLSHGTLDIIARNSKIKTKFNEKAIQHLAHTSASTFRSRSKSNNKATTAEDVSEKVQQEKSKSSTLLDSFA